MSTSVLNTYKLCKTPKSAHLRNPLNVRFEPNASHSYSMLRVCLGFDLFDNLETLSKQIARKMTSTRRALRRRKTAINSELRASLFDSSQLVPHSSLLPTQQQCPCARITNASEECQKSNWPTSWGEAISYAGCNFALLIYFRLSQGALCSSFTHFRYFCVT
jgi:hypothetical protein